MKLFREYSMSDKELLTQVRHTLNFIKLNSSEFQLCSVYKAKEMSDCLGGIADINEKIQSCADVNKLNVFQQSKILKLNRLSALLEQVKVSNATEQFVNHEPVRLAQAEAARQKIFAS